jgi:hypothetical protein
MKVAVMLARPALGRVSLNLTLSGKPGPPIATGTCYSDRCAQITKKRLATNSETPTTFNSIRAIRVKSHTGARV